VDVYRFVMAMARCPASFARVQGSCAVPIAESQASNASPWRVGSLGDRPTIMTPRSNSCCINRPPMLKRFLAGAACHSLSAHAGATGGSWAPSIPPAIASTAEATHSLTGSRRNPVNVAQSGSTSRAPWTGGRMGCSHTGAA